MYIEREKLEKTFSELEETLNAYSLPLWEQLPDIELYMDQVTSLVDKYLGIYNEVTGLQKLVTPSMINNYVKLGIIPPPVRKKYSRTHMAYLLILCTLKQTLDIATIKRIIPIEEAGGISKIYDSFVRNQQKAFLYVTENVRSVAQPIFNIKGDNQERMNDLVMQVAASANIFKIFTEKISNVSSGK